MDLSIDETYKNLIPKQTEKEFEQLEENILNDGIREPICVWQNCIVDGHTRYLIANRALLLRGGISMISIYKNKTCITCLWREDCGCDTACEYYTPVDLDGLLEEEYLRDMKSRILNYDGIIKEFKGGADIE